MSILVSDSFNRADGVLGTAETGQVWSYKGETSTDFNIVNGTATATTVKQMAYVDTGVSDLIASVKLSKNSKGQMLIFRAVSSGTDLSYLALWNAGNGLRLIKNAHTSVFDFFYTLSNFAYTPVDGDVISIKAVGDKIEAYLNDNQIAVVRSTQNMQETGCGIGVFTNTEFNGQYDDFIVHSHDSSILDKNRYLSMDGADDNFITSSVTFDTIEIDCEIDPMQNGDGRYVLDARAGLSNSHMQYDYDGVNLFWNSMYIDGVLQPSVNPMNFVIGKRMLLKLSGPSGTDDAHIFCSYINHAELKGKIFSVKMYNAGVIVAHYDMSKDTTIDQSGNENYATLTGGTLEEYIPNQVLIMDGVDDYIQTPSVTFNRISFDFMWEDTGLEHFLTRNIVSYNDLFIYTGIYQRGFGLYNPVYVDGSVITDSFQIPYSTRVELEAHAPNVYTDKINIFADDKNVRASKGRIYGVKIYNNDILVAHYDTATGSVVDRSGNGNHATLVGGTWAEIGSEPLPVVTVIDGLCNTLVNSTASIKSSKTSHMDVSFISDMLSNIQPITTSNLILDSSVQINSTILPSRIQKSETNVNASYYTNIRPIRLVNREQHYTSNSVMVVEIDSSANSYVTLVVNSSIQVIPNILVNASFISEARLTTHTRPIVFKSSPTYVVGEAVAKIKAVGEKNSLLSFKSKTDVFVDSNRLVRGTTQPYQVGSGIEILPTKYISGSISPIVSFTTNQKAIRSYTGEYNVEANFNSNMIPIKIYNAEFNMPSSIQSYIIGTSIVSGQVILHLDSSILMDPIYSNQPGYIMHAVLGDSILLEGFIVKGIVLRGVKNE